MLGDIENFFDNAASDIKGMLTGGKKSKRSRSRRRRSRKRSCNSMKRKSCNRSRSCSWNRNRKGTRKHKPYCAKKIVIKGRTKKRSRSHNASWTHKPFNKLNENNKEMFKRKLGYIDEQMSWLSNNVSGWKTTVNQEVILSRARSNDSNVKYSTLSKMLKSFDNVERKHFVKLAETERSDFAKETIEKVKNLDKTCAADKKTLIANIKTAFNADIAQIRSTRKSRTQQRMSARKQRAAAAAPAPRRQLLALEDGFATGGNEEDEPFFQF